MFCPSCEALLDEEYTCPVCTFSLVTDPEPLTDDDLGLMTAEVCEVV